MKENKFRINRFLELELLEDKTFIYVNGKMFTQCKYVQINIPIRDIERYDSIDSINDIIDRSTEGKFACLPPKIEFWAHCSNLHAWVENNYDTNLLDSILSFPLLKELSKAGDPRAKRVFKEEIAKRFIQGNLHVIGFLLDEEYLEFLTQEEISSIFSSESCPLFENILRVFKGVDMDQFHQAELIYNKIGKYLFPSVEKKLKQIIETNNLEELYAFFNYMMLDELLDKELGLLFESPLNLLEKIITILNRINHESIGIEHGLLSKKVESVLGNKIRAKLLNIINKGNIKYDLLVKLNLLKYLKNEDLNYLK